MIYHCTCKANLPQRSSTVGGQVLRSRDKGSIYFHTPSDFWHSLQMYNIQNPVPESQQGPPVQALHIPETSCEPARLTFDHTVLLIGLTVIRFPAGCHSTPSCMRIACFRADIVACRPSRCVWTAAAVTSTHEQCAYADLHRSCPCLGRHLTGWCFRGLPLAIAI